MDASAPEPGDRPNDHERRTGQPVSALWLTINQLRLLSDSINPRLERILGECIKRCAATGGLITLQRDDGPQVRVAQGNRFAALDPAGSAAALCVAQDRPLSWPAPAGQAAAPDCTELRAEPAPALVASAPFYAPGGMPIGALMVFRDAPQAAASANQAGETVQAFARVLSLFLDKRAEEDRDPDTGLLSPGAFGQVFGQLVRSPDHARSGLELLMFALPGLAQINATHGSGAGDRLIATLAQLLRRRLMSDSGCYGRISGSCLAVVFPRRLSDEHLNAAVSAIRGNLWLDKTLVEVAALSIHIHPAGMNARTPEQVLAIAERAVALRASARKDPVPRLDQNALRELEA